VCKKCGKALPWRPWFIVEHPVEKSQADFPQKNSVALAGAGPWKDLQLPVLDLLDSRRHHPDQNFTDASKPIE
jgi:hypothetical protein